MNNFCGSGTVLGTGDKVANKTDHTTALMELRFSTRSQIISK